METTRHRVRLTPVASAALQGSGRRATGGGGEWHREWWDTTERPATPRAPPTTRGAVADGTEGAPSAVRRVRHASQHNSNPPSSTRSSEPHRGQNRCSLLLICTSVSTFSGETQPRISGVVGTMFGGIESNRALLLSLLSCALAQASKVVTHWYDALAVTIPRSVRPVSSQASRPCVPRDGPGSRRSPPWDYS